MGSAIDQIVDEVISEKPPVSSFVEQMEDTALEGEPTTETASEGTPQSARQTSTVEIPASSPMFGTQDTPEIFNPEIHVTDAAGMPVKTKAGKYRRKPGRKQGSENEGGGTVRTTATVVDADNMRLQKAVAAANAVVGSLFMLGQVLGGDEFRPIVDPQTGRNEPLMMTQAWTEYFMTCENIAVPPWCGVLIATGAYFIPRFTMPVTRSRLGQMWDWISGFWTGEKSAEQTTPTEA